MFKTLVNNFDVGPVPLIPVNITCLLNPLKSSLCIRVDGRSAEKQTVVDIHHKAINDQPNLDVFSFDAIPNLIGVDLKCR